MARKSAGKRPTLTLPGTKLIHLHHTQIKPNPLNPRVLFDPAPLKFLEESIRRRGILVPITVYRDSGSGQYRILDGERRWLCAQTIERKTEIRVRIPANIVAELDKVANMLTMFHIHQYREKWDLMPMALSLEILMVELGTSDTEKLSRLTGLSKRNIESCKMLLSYPSKYKQLMLTKSPTARVKSNFFIELYPVLGLYESLGKRVSGGRSRNAITKIFLKKYLKGRIKSVIQFRAILEAHAHTKGTKRRAKFRESAARLLSEERATIKKLFEPLVAEARVVSDAEAVCDLFVRRLTKLKLSNVVNRTRLRRALVRVRDLVENLLLDLEGAE